MAKKKTDKPGISILNRRAKHEYTFLDLYEAGIILQGTEIKSIRAAKVNLRDAYCFFRKGELFVKSLFIGEYEHGNRENHEPRRTRKLLLHRGELKKLEKKVKEKGFTIVPVKLYMTDRGFAKIQVALAQGKKVHDKRQSIKEKDVKRDMQRALKSVKF